MRRPVQVRTPINQHDSTGRMTDQVRVFEFTHDLRYLRQAHAKVDLGMRLSQVTQIMGEFKDSYLVGHPPSGIMLIYGRTNLDRPPHEPNGPVAIEMIDALSRKVADRTVARKFCGAAA